MRTKHLSVALLLALCCVNVHGQFISRATHVDGGNIGSQTVALGSFVYSFAEDTNGVEHLITYELQSSPPDQIVERHRSADLSGFASKVKAIRTPQPLLLVFRHMYSAIGNGDWGHLEVWSLQNPALPVFLGQSASLRQENNDAHAVVAGAHVYYGHRDAYYHLSLANPSAPVMLDSTLYNPVNPNDNGLGGMDANSQGFLFSRNSTLYSAHWQAGGNWTLVDSVQGLYNAVHCDPLRARVYAGNGFASNLVYHAFDLDAAGHLVPAYHAAANPFWAREVGGMGDVMVGLRDTDVPVLLKAYTLADSEWVFLDDEPGLFGWSKLSVDGFNVIESSSDGTHSLHWLTLAGGPSGVLAPERAQVRVWPSPAVATVNIKASEGIRHVFLIDPLGRRRQMLNRCTSTELELSLEGVPAGLYRVEVRLQSGKMAVQPLVVGL